MTKDWRGDRIGSALRGENPTVLRRLRAGFAAIGDVQFLPGYSVLLVDDPLVQRLSDLPKAKRLSFLSDMDILGEAVERACLRLDPAFRKPELVHLPVWLYAREHWQDERHALAARHDALRSAIGEELDRLTAA